jgi:hypothetical protein
MSAGTVKTSGLPAAQDWKPKLLKYNPPTLATKLDQECQRSWAGRLTPNQELEAETACFDARMYGALLHATHRLPATPASDARKPTSTAHGTLWIYIDVAAASHCAVPDVRPGQCIRQPCLSALEPQPLSSGTKDVTAVKPVHPGISAALGLWLIRCAASAAH